MKHAYFVRELPEGLEALAELALDLSWTWSHASDAFWRELDPLTWERTQNPWLIVQLLSSSDLERLARDEAFLRRLAKLAGEQRDALERPSWFESSEIEPRPRRVAFFSLEFGLDVGLPLYAGGLGVLAGDFLKTASDLGLPVAGVGLLYQEGYFRQMLDSEDRQREIYPYNDPTSLPIQPVRSDDGTWLRVTLNLPGRPCHLRVWHAKVGRVPLYLLDSNDPLNAPADRGITSKLYGGGVELRFVQEIALGIGGWRALEALGEQIEICHLNEGHAAFVVLERARRFMQESDVTFREALCATRAGNVFTTHTPVAAGFDTFSPAMIETYFPYLENYVAQLGLTPAELLALGRIDAGNDAEPFNMAYLAMRGCGAVNGVSQLHGRVSRRIFSGLFPRWPQAEVPIGSVTNGVHVPSWDSPWADRVWTEACGKDRWRGACDCLPDPVEQLSDEELLAFRTRECADLIAYARQRLVLQLGQRGASAAEIGEARDALDPAVLTIGFARRFTEYKRPNLLLGDLERLERLLTDPRRPVQILVAGKAHPADGHGRELVRAWAEFTRRPEVRSHAVFLEDYDIDLARELVQGVDLWINTPRRPWEACGTSGMKVLVNGGLNLSVLDGWWAEAYSPEAGWAIGDGEEHPPEWDARDAEELFRVLEEEVVPLFYERDAKGVPRGWMARIRSSISRLTPLFSTNRMVIEYLSRLYAPATQALRERTRDGARLARELCAWAAQIAQHWSELRFLGLDIQRRGEEHAFEVRLEPGGLDPEWIRVELFAEPPGDGAPERIVMRRAQGEGGGAPALLYTARVPACRPAADYTPRVVPHHPQARVPLEAREILWQR